jgi:FecR protein
MSTKNRMLFKLTPVFTALIFALPNLAWAAAGKFQFVTGDVLIKSQNNQESRAAKGSEVNQGDTIVSGKSGFAQLIMEDGGKLAVKADSQIKIETFTYNGKEDGNERALFALVKGGLRAVTGEIGRTNKQNYLIKTPSATIGIRGTDHDAYYIPVPAAGEKALGVPGTYDKVNSGATILSTEKGQVIVPPGRVGFAGGASSVPVLLPDKADMPVAATPTFFDLPVMQSVVTVPAGPGAVYASTINDGIAQAPLIDFTSGLVVTQPDNLITLSHNLVSHISNGPGYSFSSFSIPDGKPAAQSGLDNTAIPGVTFYWGRYDSNFTVKDTHRAEPIFAANLKGIYHTLYASRMTSDSELAALAPTVVNATYSKFNATSPTNLAGEAGALNSLHVGVNFSNQTVTRYDLKATVAGNTWDAHLSGGPAALSTFTNGNPTASAGINLAGSCAPNCGPVSGTARGAFVGDHAQGMITSYALKNSVGSDGIAGVAALKR